MVNLDRDVKEIKGTLSSLASRVAVLEGEKKPTEELKSEPELEEPTEED